MEGCKIEKRRKTWIRSIPLSLTKPSLSNNTADVDRLILRIKKELKSENIEVSHSLLGRIPFLLRESDYSIRSLLYQSNNFWHLIDLMGTEKGEDIYGISADLGTSTVVLRLLNLVSEDIVDEISFSNPQMAIGLDILTRIHFASDENGLSQLQDLIINKFNSEIRKLSEQHGISSDLIVGMSLAGNTTMTHLFLGLNPYWICREPYIPVINSPEPVKATELGLESNPESPVLLFPSVGSYLGGDIIAGILASGMNSKKELSLFLDMGTNAEVVLGNSEWLMACAGAAGPALEGGVAKMGMMAGPGVIDKVKIDPRTREFHVGTIDDLPPVGICGSGLIDLTAQLFLSGMIDQRGKFVANVCEKRLIEIDNIRHLVIVKNDRSDKGDLTISQTDIDSLLRSKAAMYTILTTITGMTNISMEDIQRFYIAGTFGYYIDPESAITVGMIPDIPNEVYKSLGNTSLSGATMGLLSLDAKDEAYRIRDKITYAELNVNQEFMNNFSAAKFIPHTDRKLFPSVKEW